jgi:HAD ATPase, P-type, family IC
MTYHAKTPQQTMADLSSSVRGLDDTAVAERLERYGPNIIRVVHEPLWRRLIKPFCSVFMLVLFAAAAISFFHQAVVDGLIILAIIVVSALIDYTQQLSTERIIRSLQKHAPLQVRVRRHESEQSLDAEQLVPGDVIIVEEGDKIPADARVLEARSLRVDESQLTGESLPIEKNSAVLPMATALYERRNCLYQGSFVIGGSALAIVTATGNATEYGKLAALSSHQREASPVERTINKLVSQIIVVVLVASVVALGLALWRGMEFTAALQFVIALAVSAVPEGLPVAISVILAIGMQRMARRKALVRTMAAIETIGVVTTIATDKTGTLTRNKLTVQAVWAPGNRTEPLLQTLAGSTLPNSRSKMYDPLDRAFAAYCNEQRVSRPQRRAGLTLFPFEHKLAMSGTLQAVGIGQYRLCVKGAPEAIIRHARLSSTDKRATLQALQQLTEQGYRVIALAYTALRAPIDSLEQLPARQGLQFVGLVGVADSVRPEARPSIARARQAGITVRMITGDHFETAYQIGRQLGLVRGRDEVYDCRRLGQLSDGELATVVARARVFSRVIPEHKHRILTALNATDITAMTGDGVNDIPALTNANVGIAMGSGAQIARDAGDIILLDNNFRSIISAVHEGRTIYANIKRMVVYLLATNLGEVLVSIGSLLVGLPIPLLPVQILWVNLVTDTTMVIPLGVEPGSSQAMRRSPYHPKAPLLSRFMLSRVGLIAVVMAVITLGLYSMYYHSHGEGYARTIAFCALVVMQWASALAARSDYEPVWRRARRWSTAFYGGLAVSIVLQLVALFGPLEQWLHVAPISWSDGVFVWVVAFFVPLAIIEGHKWLGRTYFGKGRTLVRSRRRR